MAISIDNYLRTLSSSYYLKNDSKEVEKIEKSIAALFLNLSKELGAKIKRQFVFGSYDRDTILPRAIDEHSDVDVMVVFNHTDYERTPETYRSWLKDFAEKYYKDRYDSQVLKTFPTVTVRLNHINYDLVPAKEITDTFLSNGLYIPDTDGGWQKTDPNDVKTALTNANTRYNGIVRPIIRLMKAWNCFNSYPYESFVFEKHLTGLNFYGDNYQSGFFYSVNSLSSSYSDPQYKKDKITALQNNIKKVKEHLEAGDLQKAKETLHKVLP